MTTSFAGPQVQSQPLPPPGPLSVAPAWVHSGPPAAGHQPYGAGHQPYGASFPPGLGFAPAAPGFPPVAPTSPGLPPAAPGPVGSAYWGSPPPPPPRSRTGLVLAIGGAALALLLVAGVVGVLVLGGLGGGSGGAAVAPAGAPYDYRVPDGFTTVAEDELVGISTGQHVSAVRPESGGGTRDLVVVGVLTRPGGGPIAEDDFADQVDRAVRGNATDASEAERTTVDGSTAVQYDLTLGNGVRSRSTFILAGDGVVQVNCQHEQAEDAVLAGCDAVLGSMSIKA